MYYKIEICIKLNENHIKNYTFFIKGSEVSHYRTIKHCVSMDFSSVSATQYLMNKVLHNRQKREFWSDQNKIVTENLKKFLKSIDF